MNPPNCFFLNQLQFSFSVMPEKMTQQEIKKFFIQESSPKSKVNPFLQQLVTRQKSITENSSHSVFKFDVTSTKVIVSILFVSKFFFLWALLFVQNDDEFFDLRRQQQKRKSDSQSLKNRKVFCEFDLLFHAYSQFFHGIVLLRLSQKLKLSKETKSEQTFLDDEQKVMRSSS